MTTPQFLTFAAILIGAGVIATFAVLRKSRFETLREEAARERRPTPNKHFFRGVLLSDMRGARLHPDHGYIKGWISGPNTAVCADHANPRDGRKVHTYLADGSKIERTVTRVDRSLGHDIAILRVDEPWPLGTDILIPAERTPAVWEVVHIDGLRTLRYLDPATRDLPELHANRDGVTRLLIQGESGLPWLADGRVVSHTHRVDHGIGPNYAVLRTELLDAIASLETATP